jgi:hypothetical protein
MPLIVFILLALVCLVLIGLACACLSDTPVQALERALASLTVQLALIEVWSFAALAFLAAAAVWSGARLARPPGRASPALLQRFLF